MPASTAGKDACRHMFSQALSLQQQFRGAPPQGCILTLSVNASPPERDIYVASTFASPLVNRLPLLLSDRQAT
jgi:hypothetical protein